MLFEAAAVLPAHHIKVGNLAGTECELPRLIEAYGELCEDAAQHTDAKIVYEFMPYDAVVNTLDLALEVVEGANARQRRARDRHLAPRQARPRARRPPPHPAALHLAGSS